MDALALFDSRILEPELRGAVVVIARNRVLKGECRARYGEDSSPRPVPVNVHPTCLDRLALAVADALLSSSPTTLAKLEGEEAFRSTAADTYKTYSLALLTVSANNICDRIVGEW